MLCTHYRSAPPVPVRYSEGILLPHHIGSCAYPSPSPVRSRCSRLFVSVSGLSEPACLHLLQSVGATDRCQFPSIPTIPCLAYFSPTSKNSPQLPPLTSHIFSLLSSPLLLINNRHTPPSFSVSLSVLHCFGQTRRATPTRDTILVLHTLELFGTRHPSSQVPTSRPVIPYLLQSSLAGLAPVLESSYNRIPCDLLFRLHLSSQILLLTSQ
ncbi:hypothetical protein LB505_007674 [Fusarium chuoi]|nr:hypothetical protein LB505_007674 [Fusarium chuoi]